MKIKSLSCPNCGTNLPPTLKPQEQFDCPACHSLLVLTDLATDGLIICDTCNKVNDEQKHFCQDCGEPLRRGCPFCNVNNPVDAEHCRNCGVNIQQAQSRRQGWRNEARRHRSEWREAHQKAINSELQQFLEDLDDPENHPMAIFGLQMLGTEAVDALIDHLTDDDPDARYGAAQALGRIGDQKAIQP
ncbi:MAG: zinc ribbon domain-containing protein, partial [Chloroflexota bacterium]